MVEPVAPAEAVEASTPLLEERDDGGERRRFALGSHECAEAGDGLADDQILHLIRSFV